MSNFNIAYGWCGHILADGNEIESHPEHNVIAIPGEIFERIWNDYQHQRLPDNVEVRELGRTGKDDLYYLATGQAFSEGIEYFGTVFHEAEMLTGAANCFDRHDLDRAYLLSMETCYGLRLSNPQLMIGCSSEG